jgi:chromosome segregation ATPase
MTNRRWLVPLLLLAPFVCRAADRELVELQRDIALLDDSVRALERSVDNRLAAMMALLQQTLARVNEGNATVQSAIADRLRQQEENLRGPMADFGAKLDRAATDSLAVKETVADLNARLKRLEQKLVDLENAITIIQTPRPPPPSVSETSGEPSAGLAASRPVRVR